MDDDLEFLRRRRRAEARQRREEERILRQQQEQQQLSRDKNNFALSTTLKPTDEIRKDEARKTKSNPHSTVQDQDDNGGRGTSWLKRPDKSHPYSSARHSLHHTNSSRLLPTGTIFAPSPSSSISSLTQSPSKSKKPASLQFSTVVGKKDVDDYEHALHLEEQHLRKADVHYGGKSKLEKEDSGGDSVVLPPSSSLSRRGSRKRSLSPDMSDSPIPTLEDLDEEDRNDPFIIKTWRIQREKRLKCEQERKEREGRKKEREQNSEAEGSSSPIPTLEDLDEDDRNDPFILNTLRIQREIRGRNQKELQEKEDKEMKQEEESDEESSSTPAPTLEDLDEDDRNDPFILNTLRIEREKWELKQKERQEWKKKRREQEERSREPRNPDALRRREEAEVAMLATAIRQRRKPLADDDSLFDDSEDERAALDKSSAEKKARKRKKSADKSRGKKKKSCGQRQSLESEESNLGSDSELSDAEVNEGDFKVGWKPDMEGEDLRNEPLMLTYGEDGDQYNLVPAPLNRFLKGYQREGVQFLHSCVTDNRGALLGDDMGLGKTVQVLALLSALLKKTGTRADEKELKKRRRLILAKQKEINRANEQALLLGRPTVSTSVTEIEGLELSQWVPILIVVPASLLTNWSNECSKWTYVAAASYQDQDRSLSLESVRTGHNEVLLCGKPLFCQQRDFDEIMSVPWKLIIVDEVHQAQNTKTIFHQYLQKLKDESAAPIIGMTGTIMSNNHEELWSVVNLIAPGLLATRKDFRHEVAAPIKYSRTKSAGDEVIERGDVMQKVLEHRMGCMYLRRTKEEVLADQLPMKDQRVIFCPLENIQKKLYQHILSLPEYDLLRYMFAPCDCGVNRAFFKAYHKLRTEHERIQYYKRHKEALVARKSCCYQTPVWEGHEPEIDPKAVVWREMHGDVSCKFCPTCVFFPALSKLFRVCSHAALLQARGHLLSFEPGSTHYIDAEKELRFAEVAIPPELREQLPGGLVRDDSIMNDHISLSGKMRVLDKLLARYSSGDDRILIFSSSTRMLTLIEHFVQSRGYTYLRLDGNVPARDRQALINRYQSDPEIFLFLISTKAGGLGLNLTAANIVIVFDVSYNPANDEQAEDRSYRLGQARDVTVFRLVSQGTIEELNYIRQIYKVQMRQETLPSEKKGQSARLFNGVSGDPNRKGELFGTVNMLKYKDGSFMEDIWKSVDDRSKRKGGLNEFTATDLCTAIEKMSPKEKDDLEDTVNRQDFEQIVNQCENEQGGAETGGADEEEEDDNDDFGENVFDHKDFFRSDRGGAALKPGDEGFEDEMGGNSQMAFNILEHAEVDDGNDGEANQELAKADVAQCSVPVRPDSVLSSSLAFPDVQPLAEFASHRASSPSAFPNGASAASQPGPKTGVHDSLESGECAQFAASPEPKMQSDAARPSPVQSSFCPVSDPVQPLAESVDRALSPVLDARDVFSSAETQPLPNLGTPNPPEDTEYARNAANSAPGAKRCDKESQGIDVMDAIPVVASTMESQNLHSRSPRQDVEGGKTRSFPNDYEKATFSINTLMAPERSVQTYALSRDPSPSFRSETVNPPSSECRASSQTTGTSRKSVLAKKHGKKRPTSESAFSILDLKIPKYGSK